MKQLQHGIYSPALGERNWGEEINQNFEALDNLVGSVISAKDKCDLLATKIQDNTELINNAKDSLQEDITNAVNDLQGKIDILNNDALALKYRVDELSGKDRIDHAGEADLAVLAVSANSAKKLENSLVIGSTVFDGSSSKNVPVDDVVTHNSTNLINSRAVYNAVYNGLEAKQDKATTLSGYNITDAYTKSEINNMLSQGDNTSKAYVDIKISELVNSAPEALDTINELAAALGNDPDFATTIVNQLGTKADADHNHDDRYYTESEIDSKLDEKANNDHNHDDRYYTEFEVDSKLDEKANSDHNHDDRYYQKEEIDSKLDEKANSDHNHDDRYYQKEEIDSKLDEKANSDHNHDDYITESEVDSKLDEKLDSKLDSKLDEKLDSKLDEKLDSKLDEKLDGKANSDHNHDDRYYQKEEIDSKLDEKANSDHTHSDYITESEVDSKLDGKANADHTHSDYITGITKEMVTDALGYTPPTSDTDTTYDAGSNLSLDGTTFNVSREPSFDSITVGGYKLTIG